MSGFFGKLLGIILLFATISLTTCQSMINVISEDSKIIAIEKDKGDI